MKKTIKRVVVWLLALAMMIPMGMITVLAEEDGNASATETPIVPNADWGANADGVFEINSEADFLAFASEAGRKAHGNYKNKTIILTKDIDLNPGWDASSGTKPVTSMPSRPFYMEGTFDGQGHTIKGIYVYSTDDNAALFIVGQNKSTVKNLKIENSYFHTEKKSTGIIAVARGNDSAIIENVYVDAIFKADDGSAAGFVTWFNTSNTAATKPSVVLTNCVFAGTVSATEYAAAFVGSNDRPVSNAGAGTYSVVMTDCVNYGSVTSTQPNKAAAFIGNCANEATLTRCYNAGTVGTAFVNVSLSSSENLDAKPVVVTIEDCYYLGGAGVVATTKTDTATATVTLKYDGTDATEAKTATVQELLAKDAFKASQTSKGWTLIKNDTLGVPKTIACLYTGHDYSSVVTAPTCSTKGYTMYTCKNCDYQYEGSVVATTDHTVGDWIIDNEPTEEFSGMKHTECTVCGAQVDTVVIPKLSLTETTSPETEPVTNAANDSDTTEATADNGGCKSSIALGTAFGMSAVITLGAGMLCKKKR